MVPRMHPPSGASFASLTSLASATTIVLAVCPPRPFLGLAGLRFRLPSALSLLHSHLHDTRVWPFSNHGRPSPCICNFGLGFQPPARTRYLYSAPRPHASGVCVLWCFLCVKLSRNAFPPRPSVPPNMPIRPIVPKRGSGHPSAFGSQCGERRVRTVRLFASLPWPPRLRAAILPDFRRAPKTKQITGFPTII